MLRILGFAFAMVLWLASPAVAGWEFTGSMEGPRYGTSTGVLLQDGRVLFAQWNSSYAGAVYDPNTRTWSTTGPMRSGAGPAVLLQDGRVLSTQRIDAIWWEAVLFCPSTGLWTPTGYRFHPFAWGHTLTTLLDGRVLVAGAGDSTLIFDPAKGLMDGPPMARVRRSRHSATLLADGRVLLAGGFGGEVSAELFDPMTNTFSFTGSMSMRRYEHTATLLTDGRVLVVGGSFEGGTSCEIYDPQTGVWTRMPNPLRHIGSSHFATLLADGRVLVGGAALWSSHTEIFDPETEVWTYAGDMSAPRGEAIAVLLNDGTVLVAGGFSDLYCDRVDCYLLPTRTAELFVP